MRITKLKLNNFRNFENIDIVFPDEKIIVLIGINGTGKSTIMDAIACCLAHISGMLYSRKNSYPVETNLLDEDISYERDNVDCELAFNWPNIDLQLQLSKKRNQPVKNNIVPASFLNIIKDEIIKDKNFKIPVFCYYRSNRAFITTRFSNPSGSTYDSKLGTYSNSLSIENSAFIDFEDWYFDLLENGESVILEFVSKYIVGFISKFYDSEFPFVRPYQNKIKSIEIYLNERWVALRSLSSGERQLILLVGDISRRLYIANNNKIMALRGTGIVMIDEIELHLHPKWQRNIINALSSTFPELQFIFSTHSPQILSTISNKSIISLDDTINYTTSINPIGRDSNTILEELMNVKRRPKNIQEKVDRLLSNLALDETVSQESSLLFLEISKDLSPDDPMLLRITLKMNRLLK